MINKATIVGYLGQDPQVNITGSGLNVANLSIATTKKWTDKSGNQKQSTEWHKIILWNKLAEIAQKYLSKGSLVYVEGELQTRSWETESGEKKYVTEIVAKQLQMLGGKEKPKENQQSFEDYSQEPSWDNNEEVPF